MSSLVDRVSIRDTAVAELREGDQGTPVSQSYDGQCRALTVSGERCMRAAVAGSEPALCKTHRRLRAKRGSWPIVPGWAVKERSAP